MLNKDYNDILQILLKNKAEFLVIGAYAMSAYGYPRSTGDFDIWVNNSKINSLKIYNSLAMFGAPIEKLKTNSFIEENLIFQIGVAPRRIDILTTINGIKFNEAYNNKRDIKINKLIVPFISKNDLILNKKSTGRDKDILDINYLENKN